MRALQRHSWIALFHRARTADAVLATGFRDTAVTDADTGERLATGVWLAECVVDALPPRGAGDDTFGGTTLLVVCVPRRGVRRYTLAGCDRRPDRIFIVPATVLNRCPRRCVSGRQEEQLNEESDWRINFGLSPNDVRRYWLRADWWRCCPPGLG